MFTKHTARTVVGIIGNVIAFFLFLSPAPTFLQIFKKRSVEQFSPVPYLATFINCMLWVLYGLPFVHPDSTLVITINGTGFFMEVVYLLLFITFAKTKKDRMKLVLFMLAELLFVGVVAALVLKFAHTTNLRSTIVGAICMAGNIMMYASPLSVMKMVITTKSVEFMPFFLSFASFANGVCWTIYALIKFDIFIFAPNLAGSILGLAQLILYGIYYKSTQRQIAERKAKGEVGFIDKNNFGEPKNGHPAQVQAV